MEVSHFPLLCFEWRADWLLCRPWWRTRSTSSAGRELYTRRTVDTFPQMTRVDYLTCLEGSQDSARLPCIDRTSLQCEQVGDQRRAWTQVNCGEGSGSLLELVVICSARRIDNLNGRVLVASEATRVDGRDARKSSKVREATPRTRCGIGDARRDECTLLAPSKHHSLLPCIHNQDIYCITASSHATHTPCTPHFTSDSSTPAAPHQNQGPAPLTDPHPHPSDHSTCPPPLAPTHASTRSTFSLSAASLRRRCR